MYNSRNLSKVEVLLYRQNAELGNLVTSRGTLKVFLLIGTPPGELNLA